MQGRQVPDELSDEVLGPVNCAMGTVTQGLTVAGVHEGQAVVIQGAGGLGLTAAATAKDMGADRVIVLDRLENRLRLAESLERTTPLILRSTTPLDPSTLVLTGKRIIGSVMDRPILMSTILDFLVRTRHKLPFRTLVSHKFKLADVNEAFVRAEWHQRQTPVTRAVLVP
jgi:D-arabinose 1-dehydrogenase-like Zn-dependent alcohol dehydrogenase